jgi:hypothetical protein
MTSDLVPYIGSSVIVVWGIAHIILTGRVVKGYEPISVENRRIVTMEWVAEGLTLVFIGLLVLFARHFYGGCPLTYPATAVMLLVMAAWTALTGGRTSVTFLKISPVVETIVAILLLYSDLVLLGIL